MTMIPSEHAMNDATRLDGIWRAIGFGALLGALYGFFVVPFWSETVHFGLAWAGMMDCAGNRFCEVIFADPSLQITLPAILLKLGIGIWPLSVFFCTLFAALGFAAVTAATFALTRHTLFSLAVACFLLSYQFGNPYGYPAVFPSSTSQFGQTGQYFCLLGLVFAACGRVRTAGIIGGLLAGVHAVWCVGFLLALLPVMLVLRQRLRPLLVAFLITACAVLAFQKLCVTLLPPHPVYEAPHIPDTVEHKPIPKPTRLKYHGHTILFADAKEPWRSAIALFASIGVFALAMGIRLRTQPRDAGTRLLWMVASLTCAVTIFKLYEELDPTFSLPALLHDSLPRLILRAIFNRWFNLAGLMVPLLFAALVFHATFVKRSLVGLFALIWLCRIAKTGWSIVPPFQNMAADLIVLAPPAHFKFYIAILFLPLVVMLEQRLLSRLRIPLIQRCVALGVLLAACLCLMLSIYTRVYDLYIPARVNKNYNRHDEADEITAIIAKDKGPLILSPAVVTARGNYEAQLRTGRPGIGADVIDIYDPNTHKVIGVFCKSWVPYEPFFEFYANVQSCFEKRSVAEWRAVAKALPATGMLTPDSWKLKLKPAATGAKINYYRLPR